MSPTNKCEAAGWIAPNGDYYGSSDPLITYLHLGLSNGLMDSEIIPKSNNPDRWLELNGWIKQHGNHIICLDTRDKEKPITDAQIKTLCDVIGQDYVFLDFVNQEKYIFINKLLTMDKWQLHYEITS